MEREPIKDKIRKIIMITSAVPIIYILSAIENIRKKVISKNLEGPTKE